MGIEIVAIFVACQINLLICRDIHFDVNAKFDDSEKCRVYVSKVIELETKLRKGSEFPVVMGKCRPYLRGN